MKKVIKNNKKKLFAACLVTIIIVGYLMYRKNLPVQRDPGFEPLVEYGKIQRKVLGKCPLLNLYVEDNLRLESPEYNVQDVKCSEEGLWDIKEGEEAEVEIYTKDIGTGIAKFKEWLTYQNLEESDKLRITYVHKPK